jgi:hypothetical protein
MENKYEQILALCYQIAGNVVFDREHDITKDEELLLNTLSRPDGPGTTILLSHTGPYQKVIDLALNAEKEANNTKG